MRFFSKIGGFLRRAVSSIKERFGSDIKMTPGASSVRARVRTLKKLGIDNAATKRLKSFEDLFYKRHHKSIYSSDLNEYEYDEAYNIFESFLSDYTTKPELIEEQYNRYAEEGLVEDVDTIAEMSREIDIVNNRAIAKEIYDVLGSPTVRDVWQNFKSNKEDRRNVAIMKKAIMNTTKSIETGELPKGIVDTIKESVKKLIKGDKYTEEDVNKFTSQQRKDAVLKEYKRLKRKGIDDYL